MFGEVTDTEDRRPVMEEVTDKFTVEYKEEDTDTQTQTDRETIDRQETVS